MLLFTMTSGGTEGVCILAIVLHVEWIVAAMTTRVAAKVAFYEVLARAKTLNVWGGAAEAQTELLRSVCCVEYNAEGKLLICFRR